MAREAGDAPVFSERQLENALARLKSHLFQQKAWNLAMLKANINMGLENLRDERAANPGGIVLFLMRPLIMSRVLVFYHVQERG